MNATETSTIEAVEAAAPVKSKTPDFGKGFYSPVMKELYEDSIRLLGLSAPQAERLAWSLGADLGKHNQSVSQTGGVKIGNKNKNGDSYTVKTLCDAIKKCPAYSSTDLLKLCAMLQDCRRYGMDDAVVKLNEATYDWLNKK